jgi:hypothetical protein
LCHSSSRLSRLADSSCLKQAPISGAMAHKLFAGAQGVPCRYLIADTPQGSIRGGAACKRRRGEKTRSTENIFWHILRLRNARFRSTTEHSNGVNRFVVELRIEEISGALSWTAKKLFLLGNSPPSVSGMSLAHLVAKYLLL